MTPGRRQYVYHSRGRTTEAFETAGWRQPVARRVDQRPANDMAPVPAAEAAVPPQASSLPPWLHVIGGGAAAAVIGALLGGALHI